MTNCKITFLALCLIPLFVNAKKTDFSLYITPEDFGCVSGNIELAHENSVGLQRAIDYAIDNGVMLTSYANKKYYIKEGLKVKAPMMINFNMAALVATDTVSMLVIADGKNRKWSGKISGLMINQNKIAKYGIHCVNAIKLHISDCAIVGIPKNGAGLYMENGYENFIDNVHVEGGENLATGIKVVTHDCHFSDCAMIDCHIAVDNSGSNFFERVHAWMGGGGKWIDGSVFFRIGGGNSIFLHQCFSDTFERVFDVSATCKLFISQHKNYQNIKMWKGKRINSSSFLHFKTLEIANKTYVVLDNSYIGGLYVGGKNMQTFSNIDNAKHFIIVNSYVE